MLYAVTYTPWCRAMCSASEPQPQPASTTRSPGRSHTLRDTCSNFASCASSSDAVGVGKYAHVYAIRSSSQSE